MKRCRIKNMVLPVIFVVSSIFNVSSQETGMVVARLAAGDGPGGARITVTEVGESASIVRMSSSERRNAKVHGYRIRIFFDNKQTARAQASAARSRFQELFPGIPVDLKYDNPDFKVTAGYCLTNEEAIILWGRIKKYFPKAFLIQEDIPLEALSRYTAGALEIETEEGDGNTLTGN